MSTQTEQETQLHGGRLIARRLKAHGVTKLFTLSGGHLFSIYDGCRAEGIDIVDVRHEQSAAFAAEGWAKVTRSLGVAALTAGPGVTNGMSAIASASQNHSPMLVLGGRAPQIRWGQGSLQEVDDVPFGCLPADHELYFSRARGFALGNADVGLVIGVPLDFRLGFGAAFAEDADVIVLDVAEPFRDHPRPVAAELYGALPATLDALRSSG